MYCGFTALPAPWLSQMNVSTVCEHNLVREKRRDQGVEQRNEAKSLGEKI